MVFLYVLFFLLVGPVVLSFNIQHTLLSSSKTVKQSLVKVNAYQRLTSVKASDLQQLISPSDRDPQSQIPEEYIQQILDAVSPQILQKTIEQAVDATYDSTLNGKSKVAIDLTQIKTAVKANQPPEMASAIDQAIPNTYEMAVPSAGTAVTQIILNKYVKFIGIGLLAVIILLAVLIAPDARGKVRAASVLLLLGGLIIYTMYYASRYIPFDSIGGISANNASQAFFQLVRDFAKDVWSYIATLLKNESYGALGLGVLLFVVAFIVPRKSVPSPAPATPPSTTTSTQVAP